MTKSVKGGPATTSSDIWSLGMTMYLLAVKQLPFKSVEPFKILFEMVNSPAPVLPADIQS